MYAEDQYEEVYEARLALAEQIAAPSPGFLSRLWAGVDGAALYAATQTFVISRVLLCAITYLAMAMHPSVFGFAHPSSATFWDAWYQWDARWYVRVARSGYHFQDMHHWSSVAFFPFYPLMILALVTVIPVSTKLIAMVISNALFFAALYALHILVRREFDTRLAGKAVYYLALFPTAVFFFAGYSESTFLFCSVLSFSALRRQRWLQAALWACLASATRSQGLVLMVPFAIELWQTYGPDWRQLARGLWIGLIPLSWLALAVYMQITFNNALLFLQIQAAWHRTTTWPWIGLWGALKRLPLNHIGSPAPAHNAVELASVIFFALLIAVGWRRLPASFNWYTLASFLLVLSTPAVLDNYSEPMMSTARLCLALFPCFITLAMLGANEWVDRLVTTLGPALLCLSAVIFLQGAWVA